ncbi:MAG: sigma-70 family RNA polymerase sigma factor [Myxococcota bacterium]
MTPPLTDDDRRALVDRNLDYVRALAVEIVRTLPAQTSLDDLVAYGTKGLIEASRRYDPARGASFSTFAYYRIRGAIFDGLRTMDWFPRRSPALRFESRASELCAAVGESEAAERADGLRTASLEQQLASIDGLLGDLSIVFVATLDDFEDAALVGPSQEGAADRVHLGPALAKLPPREREVLRLHYVEDESLQQIGRRLGLSRSWASRLHARAIRLLRSAIIKAPQSSRQPQP